MRGGRTENMEWSAAVKVILLEVGKGGRRSVNHPLEQEARRRQENEPDDLLKT